MTAAKVMDIISRLPGCSEKAADAVSAYTQVKMEDAPSLLNFRSQNVQIFGYVYQSTNVQSMVQCGRPSRSSRKESVRSSLGRTFMGTAIGDSSIRIRLGKSFKLGMFICQPNKRTILICVCGRYQNGRQNRKHQTDLENTI